ncbi:DUF4132 domain-containing protein [Glycomyces sp. L485]|uniref:DUF4132 domain-containing protein n=1 Tax=Glycomyces sp. L485 TaxID=2909235 RepID=UPI001F4AB8AD|nr:DUF4132 domain-containing protein [Glycomyces sp. L485]MCH7230116.1 DUF4132 domain-containing protein [Glycomyces sp. L485]
MPRPITDLPDENRIELPEQWRELLLPRRRNEVRVDCRPDTEAEARIRLWLTAHRTALEQALRQPGSLPYVTDAGIAYLDGEADPLGAAAVGLILRKAALADHSEWCDLDRDDVDWQIWSAWAGQFGLPFAAAAAIAQIGYEARPNLNPPGDEEHDLPLIGEATFFASMYESPWVGKGPALRKAQSALAQAPEGEYAAAVAAAAAQRNSTSRRLVAALLLPDQDQWVRDAGEEDQSQGADWCPSESVVLSIKADPGRLLDGGAERIPAPYVCRRVLAEWIHHLGIGCLPFLTAPLRGRLPIAPRRRVIFDGLALMPSDEAVALLLAHRDDPQARAAVRSASTRFPGRFAKAAAASTPGLSAIERARLARDLGPELLESAEARSALTEAEHAALRAVTAGRGLPAAETERLPRLLAAPPWPRRRRGPRTKPITDLKAPSEIELIWRFEEYARAKSIEPHCWEWDEEEYWGTEMSVGSSRIGGLDVGSALFGRLAHRGAEVADDTVRRLRENPNIRSEILTPILSESAARLAADWLVRLRVRRKGAVAWLDRNGLRAAEFLVPDAVGEDARARRGAWAALRYLAFRHGDRAVVEAAGRYGTQVGERVASFLSQADPLEPIGLAVRAPKDWADPAALPEVVMRGGDAVVPRESVGNLITALSLWTPQVPYMPVEELAEHCERESLAEFSRALFELWLASDEPKSDSWVVHQMGCFGDGSTVELLEPHLLRWSSSPDQRWSLDALEAIAAIGGDTAFDTLYRISRLDRFPSTTRHARELVARLADERGDTVESLADRLAPDLGLRDPATTVLDYGSRRFHIEIDEHFNSRVVDDRGRARRTLPRPGVRDDDALAQASRGRYRRLAKALSLAADVQAGRLREAMLDGRTWTLAEFERNILGHPVIAPLARRLIWTNRSGEQWLGFRVDESEGYADAYDRLLTLPGDVDVRLAHPALLGDGLDPWLETALDYQLLQPFEQLSRPSYVLDEQERRTGVLTRFAGRRVSMVGLLSGGAWDWRHGTAGLAWDEPGRGAGLSRRLPGGGRLIVEIAEGPETTWPVHGATYHLTEVRFARSANRHRSAFRPLRGDQVDPVAASEAVTDLLRFTMDRSSNG